ncbi:MAG: hypothetical protein OEM66_03015 [Acidimicrobiia bacterium]|nr:hypothetical protein [Acidimicrobiia bacterium]
MNWWIVELATNGLLLAVVFVLGPLIKRFGRSYAGDIFRANPRTGKSYLVLMDVAYYLIFVSFILFTVTFKPPRDWLQIGSQLEDEVIRLGGMLLLMGVLHGLNVLTLPLVGRLLGLSRQLEEDTPTEV